MNIDEVIRAVQGELGLEQDGKAGPLTWTAIYERLVPHGAKAGAKSGGATFPALTAKASDRSEKIIGTLHPSVQPLARALWFKTQTIGIQIEIISGTRTFAEQDALFAKGRPHNPPSVTNAPGGHSNHNFGIAFDIGVFDGGHYLEESPKYKAVAALGKDMGLSWGGDWKSIQDEPHYEFRPGWAADLSESNLLAALRQRHDADSDIFAA